MQCSVYFGFNIVNQKIKAMDFKTKKAAYNQMQGKQYLEADQALLKSLRPNNPFANKTAASDVHQEKLQREILWLLLDMVSIEDIEENRKQFTSGTGENTDSGSGKTDLEIKIEAIQETCKNIIVIGDEGKITTALIHEALAMVNKITDELSDEENKAVVLLIANTFEPLAKKQIDTLLVNLENADNAQNANIFLAELSSLSTLLNKDDELKVRELMDSKNPINAKIEALLSFPLNDPKCDFKQVDDFFKFFGLTIEGNQKKESKIEALKSMIAKLPKEIGGTQIPNQETKDLEPAKTASTDEEKEELQEKVQELENENEELQEKVEELEDELDEQKKSSESQPESEQKS